MLLVRVLVLVLVLVLLLLLLLSSMLLPVLLSVLALVLVLALLLLLLLLLLELTPPSSVVDPDPEPPSRLLCFAFRRWRPLAWVPSPRSCLAAVVWLPLLRA